MQEEFDIFCSKSIRDGIFFESKYTIAIYDIAPVVPGHSLIIPKRHVSNFIDLKKIEFEDIFKTLNKVLPILISLYGDKSFSYNIISQVGQFSGMSVKHIHIHLIPRKSDDKFNTNNEDIYRHIDNKTKKLNKKDYIKQVNLIKNAIKLSK